MDKDKDWDAIGKALVRCAQQGILEVFKPGAKFIHMVEGELQTIELDQNGQPIIVKRRVDNLMLAKIDGKEVLMLVELQTRNHYQMDSRLLDYTIVIDKLYGQTALPCVLYLAPQGNVPTPPLVKYAGDVQVIRFDYLSEDVSKWQAEEVLQNKPIALWPLLPLTQGGLERERIESLLDDFQEKKAYTLYELMYIFTLYAFDHYRHSLPTWLLGRRTEMDKAVRDFPIIRDMIREEGERKHAIGREEGREKGLEEGLEKGLEKGLKKELRSLRGVLVDIVVARMPELRDIAKRQAALIDKPEVLRALTRKVARAQTPEEAQGYLLYWRKPTRKKQA